jgi:hypothetical protein
VTRTQIEFRIPRRAAEALPLSGMSPQARDLGIVNSRLEVTTANAGRGHVRVVCSKEMGTFLVEQFRELVVKAGVRKEPLLLIDASMAVSAILAAIEEAGRVDPPSGRDSPD